MKIGIDEVGRGCIAGSICACAFTFLEGRQAPPGVTDSKKLSLKKREALFEPLKEVGIYGFGSVSAEEIDAIGINPANDLVMRKAYDDLLRRAMLLFPSDPPSEIVVIVDGSRPPEFPGAEVVALVNADLLVPEVSAASILAKVSRDRSMTVLAKKYPGYGFEKHMGYGTKVHMDALKKLGPCDEHRHSFGPVKKLRVNT